MSNKPMQSLLETQRKAYLADGFPSAKTRIDRLDRVKDIHVRYKQKIVEALEADFGARPRGQSLATDVASIIIEVKDTRGKIRQWMKPERRKTPLMMRLTGGRAELQFQPLGVVGNISPWNFPVELAFSPAIGAFAAGNRVMLKPSELTPQTSALIEEMVSSAFDPAEMAVVTGGVGKSADIKTVADRVMGTKTINSGQLCLTPDYIFLPEGKVEAFIEEAHTVLAKCYRSLADNPDHTAVINERHWQRLRGYIDDLESRKVRIEVFNPAQESFDDPQKHKLPFVMPIEPDDDSLIMQDEIFGPMLSIKTYQSLDKVIEFINNKPRPLALYYFGKDKREIEALCQRTTSGGVTINDCAQHAACYDLPLAGVGNSGMGGYHGHHGFLQFSHRKAVYRQGLLSLGKFIRPPYSGRKMKLIDSMT